MKIGSVPYKMYMREAKLNMGVMELDEHPRRVLAQAQPSTSLAVAQPAEESVMTMHPPVRKPTYSPH